MFYTLHTIWQFVLLALGLTVLAGVSWHRFKTGAWLVIFLAPLYLLKIGPLPLTALEAMIWVFVGVWAAREIWQKKVRLIAGLNSLQSPLAERGENKFFLFQKERQKYGLFWPAALILAGVFISTIFSSDIKISLGILKSWFLAPMIFAFVAARVLNGEQGLKTIFSALFLSSVSAATVGLAYLISGRLTFDGRLAAWYLSPNHLAMWLAPGMIAGIGLWFEFEKRRQKILLSIVYCLLFIVLYFTYSYGAWLGLLAAAIFTLFYFRQSKMINQRQLLMVGCLLLILISAVALFQLYGAGNVKLEDFLTSPRSSWQSRLMIWRAAGEILRDHWLFGIGPGMFQQYYLTYQKFFPPYLEWAVPQPHNLFLAWWLQTGLLGLIGFFWLAVNFFRRGLSLAVKQPLIILSMAVIIYFLVHGLADTTFWKNDLALVFWVTVFSLR